VVQQWGVPPITKIVQISHHVENVELNLIVHGAHYQNSVWIPEQLITVHSYAIQLINVMDAYGVIGHILVNWPAIHLIHVHSKTRTAKTFYPVENVEPNLTVHGAQHQESVWMLKQ